MNANFKVELAKAIKAKIAGLKKQGTVGMSVACLKANVKPPAGGPLGTNCQYVYNEIFNEVVATVKVKGFEIY